MQEALDALVADVDQRYVSAARDSAAKVLDACFRLTGKPTVRIVANDDYNQRGYSPLSPIVAKGYADAAAERGYHTRVILTPTRSTTDLVNDDEVSFVQDLQQGDALIFASNLKSGQYSKAERMKKMTPSALCKERKAHYAFHLKLGEVGVQNPEDMLEYLNGCGVNYQDVSSMGAKFLDVLKDARLVEVVTGRGAWLCFSGKVRQPKLYCGDFSGAAGILGGNIPSGEVFTELVDLSCANGDAYITAYGDEDGVKMAETPFAVTVTNGGIVKGNSVFMETMSRLLREKNSPKLSPLFSEGIPVREMGFGINLMLARQLPNTTWLEKMPGFHFSAGLSHAEFASEGSRIDEFAKSEGEKPYCHFDCSLDTKLILVDSRVIFKDGAYYL